MDHSFILYGSLPPAKPHLAQSPIVVYRSRMPERERYGRRAAGVYGALIDPVLRSLRSKVARICQEEDVARVLDVACGTGAQCRRLARVGIRVTGVDLSEAMIAAARRRHRAGAEYVLGSAFDLPFLDASFDAAILSLALHEHAENERTAMCCQALRVLRPGGVLVVADYACPDRTSLNVPWMIVRFVETTAGPEHCAGFADFVRRGSLGGPLARHGLTSFRATRAVFGTVGIDVVRWPSGTLAQSGPN
ncbi:MAG: class I SAM-dependent methyltransferase [Candidatus Bipolaricaulota bacterium]|nr:class I SAM-dependent methyltransferase [Candidatus Bipolaricaulota bacterium]